MPADVQKAKHIKYKMTEPADMGVKDDVQADEILPPGGFLEYNDDVGDDEGNNRSCSGALG